MVALMMLCGAAALARELGRSGVQSLLAVPISFVSEHIETLEEIDMEYRELALESGVKRWGRVPALNTNPRFIEDLADAVVEALPYVGVMAGTPRDALVPMGEWLDSRPGSQQCTVCPLLGAPNTLRVQLDQLCTALRQLLACWFSCAGGVGSAVCA
jgi:hypothetical protein